MHSPSLSQGGEYFKAVLNEPLKSKSREDLKMLKVQQSPTLKHVVSKQNCFLSLLCYQFLQWVLQKELQTY